MKHRLLHMLRRMCIIRCYALSGGLLMEASPTCFCALLRGIKQAFSDTRCDSIWCTPQQLLSQLLPLLLRAQKQTSLSQSVLFQNSLSQGLTVSQRSPVTPVSLTAFTGLFQSRQDGGTQQCAKPALARFVTLLQRLKPHGETTVPSKLGPRSHLNPVLTGKTGTRGTTSRRRYRLNDPWYHRGWYRLFSPSSRHFAHLTLPNGRWRWIR